jgi:hypothetical protein
MRPILSRILCLPIGLLISCDGGADVEPTPAPAPAEPVSTPTPESPAADAPPGEREPDTFRSETAAPPPPCERLWSASLVGDEADELLCARSNVLTVLGADGDGFRPRLTVTGTGLPNAAWHGDRDGDGREEFVIAFGMGKGFATAPVRVLELDAEEGGGGWWVRTLFEYTGPRPQVTALAGPRLFLAHFTDKYTVQSGYLAQDGTLAGGRAKKMAMSQLPIDADGDGRDEVAVGRLYGDEPRSDGDLAMGFGASAEAIPTERGVRTLAAADLDGDGRDELLFGDGWHFRYKDEGKARLNVAQRGADGRWQTRLIHEIDGDFAVMRIEVRDVTGDGRPEVFASGNAEVLRLDLSGDPLAGEWSARSLGGCGTGGEFAVVQRAEGAFQILTATDPVAWLDL